MEEERYQDIISKINSLPEESLPDDFAAKVMARIGHKEKESFFIFGRRICLMMQGAFAKPHSKEECAVSFISLGFFYLVVAMILIFSIKDISGAYGVYAWLKLQPSIFVLVSVWLVLVGAVIWAKGEKAVRFAHIGSYIYISIFVIGGILVSFGGKVELMFALILSLGALITGISLDAAVSKLANEIKIEC